MPRFPGSGPDVRRVLTHLTDLGYVVGMSRKSNHWAVTDPADGRLIVTVALTPSSHRFVMSVNSTLRRLGIPPVPSGRTTPKRGDRPPTG